MPVMSVEQKGLRGGEIGGKPHAVRPGKCAPPRPTLQIPPHMLAQSYGHLKLIFLLSLLFFFLRFFFVVVDL